MLDAGDHSGAMAWVDSAFERDIESDEAVFAFATMMIEALHPGPAIYILRRLAEKHPKSVPAWRNLTKAYGEIGMAEEELSSAKKTYQLEASPESAVALSNAYLHNDQWKQALRWADERLKSGESVQAEVNKGYAYLAKGEYGKGWDGLNEGVGFQIFRDKCDFSKIDWDLKEKARVLFSYEQGIGDQLCFLSALPDAIDDGIVAGITCTDKLVPLMQDTFDVPVFSHDYDGEFPGTHQSSISSLVQVYRRESFPGTPYLQVDPDKALQWRALFDTLPGMKVGVAWTGGMKGSHNYRLRNMAADEFLNLSTPEHVVSLISLEYKPHEAIEGVHSFPWGTQGDMSQVAAMVSQLDAIVCVPTTVSHVAGALGVPCHVLCADRMHFWEQLPVWSSRSIHNRTPSTMDRIRHELRRNHSGGTGSPTLIAASG